MGDLERHGAGSRRVWFVVIVIGIACLLALNPSSKRFYQEIMGVSPAHSADLDYQLLFQTPPDSLSTWQSFGLFSVFQGCPDGRWTTYVGILGQFVPVSIGQECRFVIQPKGGSLETTRLEN